MLAVPYSFGDFELDQARFELRRKGRVLKLERIPLELLILLAEKDGNVVTRQEIVERLWGKDVFVDTEHGINTAIRKIRAALREDAERPGFVQTVPGKGYRLVAGPTPGNGNAAPVAEASDLRSPATSQAVIAPAPAAEVVPRKRPGWRLATIAAVALCLIAGAVLALNVGGLRDRALARN